VSQKFAKCTQQWMRWNYGATRNMKGNSWTQHIQREPHYTKQHAVVSIQLNIVVRMERNSYETMLLHLFTTFRCHWTPAPFTYCSSHEWL